MKKVARKVSKGSQKRKLVIDRALWLNGRTSSEKGGSAMADRDGTSCALGAYLLACGVDRVDLLRTGYFTKSKRAK